MPTHDTIDNRNEKLVNHINRYNSLKLRNFSLVRDGA